MKKERVRDTKERRAEICTNFEVLPGLPSKNIEHSDADRS